VAALLRPSNRKIPVGLRRGNSASPKEIFVLEMKNQSLILGIFQILLRAPYF